MVTTAFDLNLLPLSMMGWVSPVESGGVSQDSLDPDPVYEIFFLILFRKHECSELMH